MNEPLCGWQWYRQHRHDYAQGDIEALTITISSNGSKLTIPNRKESKGIIKDMVKPKEKGG